MLHATCSMRQAQCIMRRAPCKMQNAKCSILHYVYKRKTESSACMHTCTRTYMCACKTHAYARVRAHTLSLSRAHRHTRVLTKKHLQMRVHVLAHARRSPTAHACAQFHCCMRARARMQARTTHVRMHTRTHKRINACTHKCINERTQAQMNEC